MKRIKIVIILLMILIGANIPILFSKSWNEEMEVKIKETDSIVIVGKIVAFMSPGERNAKVPGRYSYGIAISDVLKGNLEKKEKVYFWSQDKIQEGDILFLKINKYRSDGDWWDGKLIYEQRLDKLDAVRKIIDTGNNKKENSVSSTLIKELPRRTQWKVVNEEIFSLEIPISMKKIQEHKEASKPLEKNIYWISKYEGFGILLDIKCGIYSISLDKYVELSRNNIRNSEVVIYVMEENDRIDGRYAKIIRYFKDETNKYVTLINFQNIEKSKTKKLQLTIIAECDDAQAMHIADKIFQSIKFK